MSAQYQYAMNTKSTLSPSKVTNAFAVTDTQVAMSKMSILTYLKSIYLETAAYLQHFLVNQIQISQI
jgi:hypothetical protein